jgi:hypothetical protein
MAACHVDPLLRLASDEKLAMYEVVRRISNLPPQTAILMVPPLDNKPGASFSDFQRAASDAEMEAGKRVWSGMSFPEQARKIYAQLRRIDEDRSLRINHTAARHSPFSKK